MILLTAWWGLGYAAVMVAMVTFAWYALRHDKATGLTGQVLVATGTLMLWIGLIGRAIRGHGWPFASSADSAMGIALFMLLIYLGWQLFSQKMDTGFAVTAIALILLSYGLGQQPQALAEPLPSTGTLVGTLLNLCGGSLLALAVAVSLTALMRTLDTPSAPSRRGSSTKSDDRASETLVRGALFCLAISLAIDTWWLQKVGLGNANDAQQAGVAIAWMVYFVALRLRTNPRWRGWPWALLLTVGFICTLPILINAPWLENTLPI